MHFILLYHVCQEGKCYHIFIHCTYYSIHKVVGISTVSLSEHSLAQMRELECTKRVLLQVLG